MKAKNRLFIYEYFSKNGHLEQYICFGHVDSEQFREQCQKMYSVKPLIIQHRWQRTKRIVKQYPDKKKNRDFLTEMVCSPEEQGARAITVGIV